MNYLSTTAPPAAAEWSSLLRPLRGREPEGMWNLLSIVREMFKRTDRNAIPLLEIITEECMACEQILVWWFNTKVALLNGNGHGGGKHGNMNSNAHASQHACSSLCDEIVVLWRLAALNPGLSPSEREMLHGQFTAWHMKIIDKVSSCFFSTYFFYKVMRDSMTKNLHIRQLTKIRGTPVSQNSHNRNNGGGQKDSLKTDLELFIGFKTALEACYLDWEEYRIPGITYTASSNPVYHCPFTCFRHTGDTKSEVNQVNSSSAVLNCHPPSLHHHSRRHACLGLVEFSYMDRRRLNHRDFPGLCSRAGGASGDGNRSSDSSEGFCENDGDMNDMPELPVVLVRRGMNPMNNCCDTDSQEGGGSESSSNNSNASLKIAQDSEQHRSNASSETQSDISDSSFQKSSKDSKTVRLKTPTAAEVQEAVEVAASVAAAVSVVSKKTEAASASSPSTSRVAGTAAATPSTSSGLVNGGSSSSKKSGEQETDQEKDPSRRPSKDESSSLSSDSPSGDEYNVYYYDAKAAANNATRSKDPKTEPNGSASTNVSSILGMLGLKKFFNFKLVPLCWSYSNLSILFVKVILRRLKTHGTYCLQEQRDSMLTGTRARLVSSALN